MDCIQQLVQRLENHYNALNSQQTIISEETPAVEAIPSSSSLFENFTISVGSTPSLNHHWNPASAKDNQFAEQQQWWNGFFQRHASVTLEIHPGNYTFLDRQQLFSGAAKDESCIAARVLTRVIGHYNDEHRPQTILMDAGATALTKETAPQGGMAAIARSNYTQTAISSSNRLLELEVYKMSQEVTMARPKKILQEKEKQHGSVLEAFPLDSLITLLPNHSCLAAACFDKYYVIDDPTFQFRPDQTIVEEWVPAKGW